MQKQHCHFCGHLVSLVHVHGHYQCPVCHTNALPCCDGDNCETNQLLAATTGDTPAQQSTGSTPDPRFIAPASNRCQ